MRRARDPREGMAAARDGPCAARCRRPGSRSPTGPDRPLSAARTPKRSRRTPPVALTGARRRGPPSGAPGSPGGGDRCGPRSPRRRPARRPDCGRSRPGPALARGPGAGHAMGLGDGRAGRGGGARLRRHAGRPRRRLSLRGPDVRLRRDDTIKRELYAKHIKFRVDDQGRIEVASDQIDAATDALSKLDVGPRSIPEIRERANQSSP